MKIPRYELGSMMGINKLWLVLFILTMTSTCHAAQRPPKETGKFLASNLVDIAKLEPSIKLDIRYASSNNFLGRPVYTQARALLQRPAAKAVQRAHKALLVQGYGLMITDAYRPWSVTKIFWESVTPEQRAAGFVANPSQGSRHNRGCAVDITLYDVKTGKEVAMPSAVDEMSDRASPNYTGGELEARRLRDLLRKEMEAVGFKVLENEWWHFDYQDWQKYRIQNKQFEDL
jgi:zinc D-Ala-D-Ala dipeptidase